MGSVEVVAASPSTYRLNMQNAAATKTVSWMSSSPAPAARAASTSLALTSLPERCTFPAIASSAHILPLTGAVAGADDRSAHHVSVAGCVHGDGGVGQCAEPALVARGDVSRDLSLSVTVREEELPSNCWVKAFGVSAVSGLKEWSPAIPQIGGQGDVGHSQSPIALRSSRRRSYLHRSMLARPGEAGRTDRQV